MKLRVSVPHVGLYISSCGDAELSLLALDILALPKGQVRTGSPVLPGIVGQVGWPSSMFGEPHIFLKSKGLDHRYWGAASAEAA